jgi:hypothetical protein
MVLGTEFEKSSVHEEWGQPKDARAISPAVRFRERPDCPECRSFREIWVGRSCLLTTLVRFSTTISYSDAIRRFAARGNALAREFIALKQDAEKISNKHRHTGMYEIPGHDLERLQFKDGWAQRKWNRLLAKHGLNLPDELLRAT